MVIIMPLIVMGVFVVIADKDNCKLLFHEERSTDEDVDNDSDLPSVPASPWTVVISHVRPVYLVAVVKVSSVYSIHANMLTVICCLGCFAYPEFAYSITLTFQRVWRAPLSMLCV